MNLKEMTYEELEAKLLGNRCALRATKDLEEKRRLVSKDHDLMLEMDRRLDEAERLQRISNSTLAIPDEKSDV